MNRIKFIIVTMLFSVVAIDRLFANAFWNLMAAIHFEELRPDLNDLPVYQTKIAK